MSDMSEIIKIDTKGNLVCAICDTILGEFDITPEDEKGLPGSIKIHYSTVHGRNIEVEFDLS